MMEIRSNTWKEPMIIRMMTMNSVEESSGMVTWKKRCTALAPSSSADSYSDLGMDCMPDSRMTM